MKKFKEVIKHVREQRVLKEFAKRNVDVDLKKLAKIKHGELVVMIQDNEKMTKTFYIMNRIYFREYDLSYSCHPNTRKGRELFISNMYIPKVKLK